MNCEITSVDSAGYVLELQVGNLMISGEEFRYALNLPSACVKTVSYTHLDVYKRQVRAIAEADVLIIGGTSLNVYPAAGFINYYHGNKLVLINKSETPYDRQANLLIHDSIGKVLKTCVADL